MSSVKNLQKKKAPINPYVLVLLSFLVVILIGSVLLTTPWAQANGKWASYIDALTLAVSATCVTGTSTFAGSLSETLTLPGQVIMIIMIQIGGLGFITILTFIVTIFKQKLQFKDRYFISQMVGSTNFADVVRFVRKIMLISFVAELIGFLLFLPSFSVIYKGDIPRIIWNSVFHSISSFNNAGFDLTPTATSFLKDGIYGGISAHLYYYHCSVSMLLIITGGISFLVIADVFNFKKKPKQWKAFTKVVLLTNSILLIGGIGLLFLTDGLKATDPMSFFDCIFQSVTARTAGFYTYPQYKISTAGKIIVNLLMLVGGSPLSTAGGIKTTTVFILFLTMFSYFAKKKPSAFKRSFSMRLMVKSMSLIFVSLFVIILAYLGLQVFGLQSGVKFDQIQGFNGEYIKDYSNYDELCLYQVITCFGTVGLPTGIEPYLSVGSKIVLCLLMFLGRLGPFTFFQVFQSNMDEESNTHYQLVEEDLLIG